MPREQFFLEHVLESADAVQGYLAGRSFDEFAADDRVRRAVLQRLGELGEATARLPAEFRERHADVAWNDADALRGFAAVPTAVDWHAVWIAATRTAPALAERVGELLDRADVDPA